MIKIELEFDNIEQMNAVYIYLSIAMGMGVAYLGKTNNPNTYGDEKEWLEVIDSLDLIDKAKALDVLAVITGKVDPENIYPGYDNNNVDEARKYAIKLTKTETDKEFTELTSISVSDAEEKEKQQQG